jgi:polyketide cyclase/dehydrase/lipid transport protein
MVRVERTVTVRTPVELVAAYLADFTHTEDWDPGTVTCTRIGTGPLEVGARWHNERLGDDLVPELTRALEKLG